MLRPGAPLVSHLALRSVALAVLAAGCRLGPLVDDQPGASANILPANATIPSVSTNKDLTNQITLNDSLDSNVLAGTGGVIKRAMAGFAGDGKPAVYWSFGTADRAPAPIYVFGTGDPTSPAFVESTSHPPLVEAVPGDPEYEPFHTLFHVAFTDNYKGQKITTAGALTDAIELGLVQEPVAVKLFINWPIVRPGTLREVGGQLGMVPPTPVYAHGYLVDSYPLGGAAGRQPIKGLLPTRQVSFLRGPGDPDFDRTRPIFQATAPAAAPTDTTTNYSAASIEVDVDVRVSRTSITSDGALFVRTATGDIMTTDTGNVLTFTVTTHILDLQLQLKDGDQ
ncbi:MAG TPA: hypothetical protein VHW23_27345 [Kofleriaceae bacterium]|nr:hypothetical protein [Kofleriaceae bacterium]